MEKLYELDNISKSFAQKKALKNISLTIYEKDVVCLVGENGSGKTTLLNLLAKSLLPNELIFYINQDIFKKQKIGFLLQKSSFPINLKVKQLLKIIKWNEKDKDFHNYLYDELEIENILENKLFHLSGGEKQKLEMFQVLVSKPQILILDEYSNNIDLPTTKKLKQIISKYIAETNSTLILSSHKKAEMDGVCKRIVILNDGKITNQFENKNGFGGKEFLDIINLADLVENK